jgi:DNA-binding transcriptional ArsR family regulator
MSRDLVFSALSDPHRRLLLERLMVRGGQTLSDLSDGLMISRQAVRKHLDVLEAAELVSAERDGRKRLHYLNPVPIHSEALPWLNQFERVPMGVLVGGGK